MLAANPDLQAGARFTPAFRRDLHQFADRLVEGDEGIVLDDALVDILAEESPGIVLYTLVDAGLSGQLEQGCRDLGIPCVSVLEPVLAVEITHVYGRDDAYEAIRRSQADYTSAFMGVR